MPFCNLCRLTKGECRPVGSSSESEGKCATRFDGPASYWARGGGILIQSLAEYHKSLYECDIRCFWLCRVRWLLFHLELLILGNRHLNLVDSGTIYHMSRYTDYLVTGEVEYRVQWMGDAMHMYDSRACVSRTNLPEPHLGSFSLLPVSSYIRTDACSTPTPLSSAPYS